MDPARWKQVDRILQDVLDQPAAERTAFLARACAGDQELRAEVESLLEAHHQQDSFLEPPGGLPDTVRNSAGIPLDDSFGPYTPVRVLGEGGMGTVYLARQHQPLRREVALKVVKAGMDSRHVIARFDIERRALALMDHPNVARVMDAGTSVRGRPYFVMEYADGIPITRYCDEKLLGTRQRLRLFMGVCHALQHAHRRGIIHRDVKPSNILVTEVDGKAVPKVIDFGVARATDPLSSEAGDFTIAGQILGTPEYMSPEQAGPEGRDIDTSTDVYSLGVVLYELLVGALPVDLGAARKGPFSELLRAIRETPVPKPTTRISQMGADAAETARRRGTDPSQWKRELSGDIDWIVMKAIDKDRARRYASPLELAGDLDRYLGNQPVLAGPPSAAYRARKFVVRHKGVVAAASLVLCALVAGLITTAHQARVANEKKAEAERQRVRAEQQAVESTRQRDAARAAGARAAAAEQHAREERNAALAEKRRADNEAATAKAVNDFLQDDLLAQAGPDSQSGPGHKPDPDLKVRTALDRAAARIAGSFQGKPLVEASIRTTLGEAYRGLGQYPEEQREFERALELRRRELGDRHRDTLMAMRRVAISYLDRGRYAQSEPLLTRAAELQRRVLGERHPDTLVTMNRLAELYYRQGRYATAEPLLTRLLDLEQGVLGPEHPETLSTIDDLGLLYRDEAKYAQAEPLLTRALEVARRVHGEEHSETLMAMFNLAALYRSEHRYAEAEPLARAVLETTRRVLGPDHPETVIAMGGLGGLYYVQGKYAEAEALATKVVEIDQRVLGPEHPDTLIGMNNLALLYLGEGKHAEAEPLITRVLAVRRRLLGEEHPTTLNAMYTLGALYLAVGKYEEAEPLLTRTLEIRRRVLGPQHPNTTQVMTALATLRLHQRNYPAAETLLRDALGNFEKLPDTWERYLTQSRLGASLIGQQKYAEAEPLLLAGYQGLHQRANAIPKDRAAEIDQAANRIVELYQDWGKPAEASEWQAKLVPRR